VKISVVTVCCNSAKTIGYTLESFFKQDYREKELVVIDAASTDATLNIVRSFPQEAMIIVCEPDRGIYDAMNKGLGRFTGDAIGFLNSDDRFHDDQVLYEIATALGQSDIVFGNIDFVADHISSRVVRKWRGSAYRQGAFRRGWMPPHPSCYVRRAVVNAVGLFDLRYRTAADYDWMLRAFELYAFRTRFVDRTLVNMQTGGDSTSGISAYIRGNMESLQARRSHFGTGPIDLALFIKPLRKLTQFAIRQPVDQDLM
jgi:glycosyltransferase involved in cell wall biosynthesis